MDRTTLLLFQLKERAAESHEGNLTILQVNGTWRIGFGTVTNKEQLEKLADGASFDEAAIKAVSDTEAYAI